MCTLSQIRGRNGIPEMRFKNGIVKYSDEEKCIVIAQRVADREKLKSIKNSCELPIVELGDGEQYIPSMVYRALVKAAMGFIPEDNMRSFAETKRWLMNLSDKRALPKIACCIYPQGVNPQPEVILYLRFDSTRKDLPFAVVSLIMCGMRFLYIMPFCKEDSCDFTNDDDYDRFWETFALYSKAPLDWRFEDLSIFYNVTPRLNLSFRSYGE